MEPNLRRCCLLNECSELAVGPQSKQVSLIVSYGPFLQFVIIPTDIIFDSPANAEAAGLYRDNVKKYIRGVKLTVEESWMDPSDDGRQRWQGTEASAAVAAS